HSLPFLTFNRFLADFYVSHVYSTLGKLLKVFRKSARVTAAVGNSIVVKGPQKDIVSDYMQAMPARMLLGRFRLLIVKLLNTVRKRDAICRWGTPAQCDGFYFLTGYRKLAYYQNTIIVKLIKIL